MIQIGDRHSKAEFLLSGRNKGDSVILNDGKSHFSRYCSLNLFKDTLFSPALQTVPYETFPVIKKSFLIEHDKLEDHYPIVKQSV